MDQSDPLKLVRSGAILTMAVAILSAVSNVGRASAVMSETARNQHNFILTLNYNNFINGNWSGDADFTISECPQPACFRLSGTVKLPRNRFVPHINEGSFPITGSPCDLYIEEVPIRGMDSGDWRISFINKDQDGAGCASLPPGLAGVYEQVD